MFGEKTEGFDVIQPKTERKMLVVAAERFKNGEGENCRQFVTLILWPGFSLVHERPEYTVVLKELICLPKILIRFDIFTCIINV